MPGYVFNLVLKNSKSGQKILRDRSVVDVADVTAAIAKIYEQILEQERDSRYEMLIMSCENPEDPKALESCLPEKYKPYVHDIEHIKKQLCSMDEVHRDYRIEDLHEEKCYGCLYNSQNRSDHTVCPTGCEHDLDRCWLCA